MQAKHRHRQLLHVEILLELVAGAVGRDRAVEPEVEQHIVAPTLPQKLPPLSKRDEGGASTHIGSKEILEMRDVSRRPARSVAPLQSRKHDFLGSPRGLPGILHQFGCFSPSYPPPRAYRLEPHVSQSFSSSPATYSTAVWACGEPTGRGPNVLGEVRHLLVGVVVSQSRVADRDELLQQCRRKRSRNRWFCTFVVGIDGTPCGWASGTEGTEITARARTGSKPDVRMILTRLPYSLSQRIWHAVINAVLVLREL